MKKNPKRELEYIQFHNPQEFREWLSRNHDKSPGIWIIFYKNHLKKDFITYSEALEEELCFGWIDSIIKRLDEERYARKFIPRRNTSKWSEFNKKKVSELIKAGRMTEAGLRKIKSYLSTGKINWENEKPEKKPAMQLDVPDFLVEELSKNEPALTNFNNLAPTYKKYYVFWISSARREETVRKRLDEAIALLKENKKLGLK